MVELLAALVLGGLLTTVLLQLMQGNGRFLAMQSAREEVQQNGRASLDLISSDLRTLPRSAIREMGANSIGFYLPRAWGVLCDTLPVGSQTAYVLFPAGSFPGDFTPGAKQWGVAVEQTPRPDQPTRRYRYVTEPTRTGAGSRCDAIQPNAGDAAMYLAAGFTVGSSLADAAEVGAGGTILPGTQVMVFEEVRYDVAEGSGPPGIWIRRMSGYGVSSRNMQPMAGPLPSARSLVFTYLQPDGITAAAAPADVGRIRVWLEVESRSRRTRGDRLRPEQTDTMTTDVILRNQ